MPRTCRQQLSWPAVAIPRMVQKLSAGCEQQLFELARKDEHREAPYATHARRLPPDKEHTHSDVRKKGGR